MSRNTTTNGGPFSNEQRIRVWEKAVILTGRNPNEYRKDRCGALIRWADYGDTSKSTGWEIDHILPKSKGGQDYLSNLQPLHWENNRRKSDDFPAFETSYCVIRS